jgi:hypothetical protein
MLISISTILDPQNADFVSCAKVTTIGFPMYIYPFNMKGPFGKFHHISIISVDIWTFFMSNVDPSTQCNPATQRAQ